MTHKELEKRYKQWCNTASRGDLPPELSNGMVVTIGPQDRRVPTTALVVRTDQGNILPMPSMASILRDTAQRIDKNAASLKTTTSTTNKELLVLDFNDLTYGIASLCSFSDKDNGLNGLGIQHLPFTIGKWVAGIRMWEKSEGPKTTEEKLVSIFQIINKGERFRYVTVYQSYADLPSGDVLRRNRSLRMLQFKEGNAPLMDILGEDLDRVNVMELRDPNVLGVYLCRKSLVKRIEENAQRALTNFMVFTPLSPLDHVLATRLKEASRIYGNKIAYLIQRFTGTPGPGPIIREIPGLLNRAKTIVREHHGMMQVAELLVRLPKVLLHVEGQRDGAKERGLLHNLRHTTAARPSGDLVFFLNVTRVEGQNDQQTFAPPVLSEFDLQEDSSGASKPSWAKSLLDLEQMTRHDTTTDMRGSSIVTMVGFPFQCTFVLENEPGQPFYYCPHRFSNRQDAIEHVRAVHQGEGLTEETIVKIAQVDDQLANTEFGKMMQPINEVAKVRQLKLDERDPNKLRLQPTLHADLYEMSRVIMHNTRLLERLEQSREETAKILQAVDRSTDEGVKTVKRHRQLFATRNRAITEVKKHMLSPASLVSHLSVWTKAKARKSHITSKLYGEFVRTKDQLLWLERTQGADVRRYEEQVKALGGVDPGAIPAGVPGGGLRVSQSNIGGMLTQDLIEQTLQMEAVQDANDALIAVNREATYQRVVSQYDQDFGASNVLPAATPLLAAEGWEEDSDQDTSHDQASTDLEPGSILGTETVKVEIPPSNPLKRSRPKDESHKTGPPQERAVALVGASGFDPTRSPTVTMPIKVQVMEPTVPTFLKSFLEVELQRIFRVCGLNEAEKKGALDACKRTLNLAFHPRCMEEAMAMNLKDALNPGQIRTLMDPLRTKVSVLVLTDPRLVLYPNGVLMRTLSACVALIDRMHKTIVDNDSLLCSMLANGVCTLLQPRFQLSMEGLRVAREALQRVLLERIEDGREGHWKVLTRFVETLNSNLKGFWDAALLRRYHAIQDPSHKTCHVESDPEVTYAPPNQLPSVAAVTERIRRPRICDTSVLSVSPRESSTTYPNLRAEEAKTLMDQVAKAVSGSDARLVRIRDNERLDAKTWIDRLVKGNANATDNPHAMCTWFREKKVTLAECTDEEKHQWLRHATCCICSDLLGSAPFEGWCCLSGASSVDCIVDQAIQGETDPIRHDTLRETLRQKLMNIAVAQPHYPGFHLWHKHCKEGEDCRRLIEAYAKAPRTDEKMKKISFDECPLCCTKYPRDESSFPSMSKMSRRVNHMERTIRALVPDVPVSQSSSLPHKPLAIAEPSTRIKPEITEQLYNDVEHDPTEQRSQGGESKNDSEQVTAVCETGTTECFRTGVAYLGALFQNNTGCQPSPAGLIPPQPNTPPPEHGTTLYDSMTHPSDDPNRELREVVEALEATRSSDIASSCTAEIPLNISAMNNLLDELADLNYQNLELDSETTNTTNDFDMESLVTSLMNNQGNPLLQNIETSALDRDAVDERIWIMDDAIPMEPIAAVSPEDENASGYFGPTVMGGSGACLRGCCACPFMMPRTNQLGTYRLTTPIDCTSCNVVYASICHTCAILHGVSSAVGSLREEVRLLQAMSRNNPTLLSKCPLGHAPTIIGLDTFTNQADATTKENIWKSKFCAMASIEAVVT